MLFLMKLQAHSMPFVYTFRTIFALQHCICLPANSAHAVMQLLEGMPSNHWFLSNATMTRLPLIVHVCFVGCTVEADLCVYVWHGQCAMMKANCT